MVDKLRTRRWKMGLTIFTFLALAGTGYALREQILDTLKNLQEANPLPILLIIPLALLNHYSQGKMYQSVFRILGNRFRTKSMMRLSLELNFVNYVFPSAGVSGFSYLSLRMRDEGIMAGKATLVQIMRFALLFVSFQLLLGLGLLMLAFSGDVNNFVMLVAGSLATLLLVGTAGAVHIISSQRRLNAFFTSMTRIVNRVIHIFRPKYPETISLAKVREIFTELHENYQLLRTSWLALQKPLIFATIANIAEVAAIWSVFWAFGEFINPGAVIIAYAVANFAGIVSVLPGGIGVYEGLMTGVFAAAGVRAGTALPVILAFRVVSMVVQLLPGYIFYQRAVQYEPPLQHELK